MRVLLITLFIIFFGIPDAAVSAEFPPKFLGTWQYVPYSQCPGAIITRSTATYGDAECKLLKINKENDKYKLIMKCAYDDGSAVQDEEWGILSRDPNKRFLIIDNGYDFTVLERCENQK